VYKLKDEEDQEDEEDEEDQEDEEDEEDEEGEEGEILCCVYILGHITALAGCGVLLQLIS